MICAERDQLDHISDSPKMPSFPAGNDLGEEGLYYFNARWYDAELGRFITEDPIKDGINWYGYANQNPLIFIDPTGLEAVPTTYGEDIDGDGRGDGPDESGGSLPDPPEQREKKTNLEIKSERYNEIKDKKGIRAYLERRELRRQIIEGILDYQKLAIILIG